MLAENVLGSCGPGAIPRDVPCVLGIAGPGRVPIVSSNCESLNSELDGPEDVARDGVMRSGMVCIGFEQNDKANGKYNIESTLSGRLELTSARWKTVLNFAAKSGFSALPEC